MLMLLAAGLLAFQSEPSGTPEQLNHYKLARHYNRPKDANPSFVAMGLISSNFGTRYASVLIRVHESFESGRGLENAYQMLLKLSTLGGPPGAAEHVKALAASLKDAVLCKDCKNGKAACTACQGKGRTDQSCAVCKGTGQTRASGALPGSDVTVKCRNCDGQRIFKGVGCSTCSRTGLTTCGTCNGKPWREVKCSSPSCKNGRAECTSCHGKGEIVSKCPFCEGGRFRTSGAVGDANVTAKCRNCEKNGQQGDGTVKQDCPTCKKTGRVTCERCGGPFGKKNAREGAAAFSVDQIFTAEPCGDCGGSGWPQADKAVSCAKCLGLGVKLKPASDPSKTID